MSEIENLICVKPEEHPYIAAGSDIKNTRELIHIPNGADYVEILGHKLYGDFGSFEKFCDYLKKCDAMEERWRELEIWLVNYKMESNRRRRSCMSPCGISVGRVIYKMRELEGKNS